jgi:HPt (histidine-containing phosphotransfer) domain-containing protein
MNTVLKKFIPKQDVDAEKSEITVVEADTPAVNPELADIFVRETTKTIAALEGIYSAPSDNDLQTYTISVHGLKSALANIGESDLSAVAAKLEQAGRDKNIGKIAAETPAFLDNLRALVTKLTPPKKDRADENVDEDLPYLRDKLLVIQTACTQYDIKTADETITELRQKQWSSHTEEALIKISEYLLHSDFDETVDLTEDILKTL